MGNAMKVDLPHLLQDTDRHGNRRLYYRRAGRKMVRLHAEPGTPEFLEEYAKARDGLTAPKAATPRVTKATAGSLRWLIEGYYQSANFKTLAAQTQTTRRGILEHICLSVAETSSGPKERGTLPFAEMRAKHVRAIRDVKLDLPGAANGWLKSLGQVFAWAMEEELIAVDPTATVDFLPGSSTGFHTWTVEEVRQYEKHYPLGTKARLALDLLLYTGVRRSDVVKLGRHMERDGALHFIETKGSTSRAITQKRKTPKKRSIRILPQLRASIDATPSGNLTYLVTAYDRPFTVAGFGGRMRDWCNSAGLPHCTAHGLRKAGATIAAENGVTVHELMAMYGWENLRQAEIYTREANKEQLAHAAQHLVVPGATKRSAR